MADDGALWLYAVTPGPLELPDLAGVGGAPVRTIGADGLVAVASDVPSAEFGASALRANLEDLSWLEATAMAHHRVIDGVAQLRPVVPMRLATVYSRDENVRAMLSERGPDIRAVLDRTSSCREWGVKAYAVRQEQSSGHGQPAAGAVSGADYLQRRRAELAARQDSQQDARACADQVHAALSRLAVGTRLHPPQAPQLSGTTAPMMLNAAYLVPDSGDEEFAAVTRRLAGQYPSVELHLTGPWPPYSFAALREQPGESTEPAVTGR